MWLNLQSINIKKFFIFATSPVQFKPISIKHTYLINFLTTQFNWDLIYVS